MQRLKCIYTYELHDQSSVMREKRFHFSRECRKWTTVNYNKTPFTTIKKVCKSENNSCSKVSQTLQTKNTQHSLKSKNEGNNTCK